MSKRYPTGPVLVTPEVAAELPTQREPTNGDLASQLIRLERSFADHAETDARELGALKAATSRQTVIISAVVTAAAAIGAFLHSLLGIG